MAVTSARVRGAREPSLFETTPPSGGVTVFDGNDDFRLYRRWLSPERADATLAAIRATTTWSAERRKMYDRFVDVPRLQAWFGDDRERPFPPHLDALRRELEALAATPFSYVLLNRYRDGKDSVAWHHDRTVPGRPLPVIASLSLGETRAFDIRRIDARSRVTSIDVDHGDLIVMRGASQVAYEHRIAKDRRVSGERINLTFRQLPD